MILLRVLPPKSVLRLKKLWVGARKKGHYHGELLRVDYYSPQGGLDAIRLVDRLGNLIWGSTHDWIYRHFEVVYFSGETDPYGTARAVLRALSDQEHKKYLKMPGFPIPRWYATNEVPDFQSVDWERSGVMSVACDPFCNLIPGITDSHCGFSGKPSILLRVLPPKSVLRLNKLWPYARKQGHYHGELRRVGYYSQQDGLDVIWLVDRQGDYNWTFIHELIYRHFEVIYYSDETDPYGTDRAVLTALSDQEHEAYLKMPGFPIPRWYTTNEAPDSRPKGKL